MLHSGTAPQAGRLDKIRPVWLGSRILTPLVQSPATQDLGKRQKTNDVMLSPPAPGTPALRSALAPALRERFSQEAGLPGSARTAWARALARRGTASGPALPSQVAGVSLRQANSPRSTMP